MFQYSCEDGSKPRCKDGRLLPLVTPEFCPQGWAIASVEGGKGVWRPLRPMCEDLSSVVMSRLDRGFTCRKGEGGIHRPGGLPLGVRRWPVCKEGDELCKEFQNKCYFIINGCGEKWMVGMHSGRAGGLGGWRNFLLKNLESKKNNRIKINDWSAYMKKRRQWWLGLD